MINYLSLDTEATGLTKECVLIQLAFVPVDNKNKRVATELGREWLVQCASYEELEPILNPWVKENNKTLIQNAHAHGIPVDKLAVQVAEYLSSPEIKALFGTSRPVILGKSLSALDIPLLTRTFGEAFMQKYFHHHTLDVTCVARFLVDAGILPPGCESTSQIVKHYGVREVASHTALNDASDMAQIYLKMLAQMQPLLAGASKQ